MLSTSVRSDAGWRLFGTARLSEATSLMDSDFNVLIWATFRTESRHYDLLAKLVLSYVSSVTDMPRLVTGKAKGRYESDVEVFQLQG